MGAPQAFSTPYLERFAWFHGWTYNTTPGSRTQFSSASTDRIYNGYSFCFDYEAYEDRASLPTGMYTGQRLASNSVVKSDDLMVTKAATGILGQFAGVVVDLPPEGLRPDREVGNGGYKGGIRLKLRYSGPALALILGDMSSNGFEELLAPVNAQWYLGIVALGTNGANLPLVCGHPRIRTNVSSAAVSRVILGPMGHPL